MGVRQALVGDVRLADEQSTVSSVSRCRRGPRPASAFYAWVCGCAMCTAESMQSWHFTTAPAPSRVAAAAAAIRKRTWRDVRRAYALAVCICAVAAVAWRQGPSSSPRAGATDFGCLESSCDVRLWVWASGAVSTDDRLRVLRGESVNSSEGCADDRCCHACQEAAAGTQSSVMLVCGSVVGSRACHGITGALPMVKLRGPFKVVGCVHAALASGGWSWHRWGGVGSRRQGTLVSAWVRRSATRRRRRPRLD